MTLSLRRMLLMGTLCAAWPSASAARVADPSALFSTGWESGVGTCPDCWCADNGVWAVASVNGTPQGTMAAGTVPGGSYPTSADSRFVGPAVVLPATPADGKLWLSFHHWFNLWSGDSCFVEIGTGGTICGTGTTWERVGRPFVFFSGDWTRYLVDLSQYAGQSVRVAFHIKDNGDSYEAAGWFIDSLDVLQGAYPGWSPEGFENGHRGWYADHGVWRIAPNTGAPEGAQIAVSGDNYPNIADSRLISSAVTLPTPSDGVVSLSFFHWFNLWAGDSCFVEISPNDGPWERVGRPFVFYSGDWTRYLVDLSQYAGQSVRVAFHIKDNGDGYQAAGWFIDSLEVVEGGYPAWSPEGFESGYRGWYADQGVWRIAPDTGAPEGTQVAVSGGNYPTSADSRLVSVSARLDVPPLGPPPVLAFKHWFSFWLGDSGWVEVSAAGGAWERVSIKFAGSSGGWTQHFIDLTAYLTRGIRIAFHIEDNGDGYQSTGWLIDDVSLQLLTPVQLSLADVSATAERVRLHWFVADETLPRAEVQRRTTESAWVTLGEVFPDGEGHMIYTDTAVEPGMRYGYRLRLGAGPSEEFGGEVWVDVPALATFALEGLRPNPAFHEITVAFTVASAEPVELALYDVSGRSVLARAHEITQPGWHSVTLGNARDIPAGLYFLRLTQGARSLTKRACLVQ